LVAVASTDTLEQTQEELVLAFLVDSGDDFTSGEALSDKLGLSRTAVWKYVDSLRNKGYRIDAIPARGYKLVEVPDRLTSLELSPLLNTHDLGRGIHHHETVPSTNQVAFELATDGAAHGEVVIAEQQTQGRGRRGRTWVSPAQKNLYLSIILRPEQLPPQRAPELTLVAAVALAETIREAGIDAEIKWPNDVHVGGRKLAGILTELSAEPERVHFAILGIGVNLNATAEDFPPELRELATSLSEIRGERIPRALFAAALLSSLEKWLDLHAAEGFEPVRAAWKLMSSTLGQEILVKTEKSELRGTAVDVDASGALVVETAPGKVERVHAGDVEQVRPRVQKPRD
jgi:BirA family transcriptional regulator, biotin operon repressor / biotin---[acetyl-CoA-carboxylase] ligase